MDLSGKVISLLAEVSGSSKSGNAWRKQEYIVETGGQYPKKVCVAIWGDKIDQFGLKVGEQVNLGIEVESREYNGRWYTDVKAWKVSRHTFDANSSKTYDNQDEINQQIKNDNSYDNSDIPF